MKLTAAAVTAVVLLLGFAQPARAQKTPTTSMTVSPPSFNYPSGDPDSFPTVSSPSLTIQMSVANMKNNQVWVLSLRANTDLVSGSDSIPSSNVTWTATPAPFVNGTLNTTDQTMATGGSNGSQTGYVTFTLKNLWTYKVGTYSQNIVFTLTVP